MDILLANLTLVLVFEQVPPGKELEQCLTWYLWPEYLLTQSAPIRGNKWTYVAIICAEQ